MKITHKIILFSLSFALILYALLNVKGLLPYNPKAINSQAKAINYVAFVLPKKSSLKASFEYKQAYIVTNKTKAIPKSINQYYDGSVLDSATNTLNVINNKICTIDTFASDNKSTRVNICFRDDEYNQISQVLYSKNYNIVILESRKDSKIMIYNKAYDLISSKIENGFIKDAQIFEDNIYYLSAKTKQALNHTYNVSAKRYNIKSKYLSYLSDNYYLNKEQIQIKHLLITQNYPYVVYIQKNKGYLGVLKNQKVTLKKELPTNNVDKIISTFDSKQIKTLIKLPNDQKDLYKYALITLTNGHIDLKTVQYPTNHVLRITLKHTYLINYQTHKLLSVDHDNKQIEEMTLPFPKSHSKNNYQIQVFDEN